jgi:uncharacterized membrane protein YidH (DUF202 family)
MDARALVGRIAELIINPTITLLFGAAILIFVWGVAEYIRGSDQAGERTKGAQHMIWGVIGIFIMVSAVALLKLFRQSIFGA